MNASSSFKASSRKMRSRSEASNASRRPLMRLSSAADGAEIPNWKDLKLIGIVSSLVWGVAFLASAAAVELASEAEVVEVCGSSDSSVIDSLGSPSSPRGAWPSFLDPRPKNPLTSSTMPFLESTSQLTKPLTASGSPSTGPRRTENLVVMFASAHPKFSFSLATEAVRFCVCTAKTGDSVTSLPERTCWWKLSSKSSKFFSVTCFSGPT